MPSSTSASKALGLGLGLAIFAGAEQAIWSSHEVAKFLLRRPPAAASGDTFEVASRILLMDRQGPAPLVLLGSSQVREGLDCDILVNGPCLNLGIGGGSPLDMLYVARELGNRPRTLVVAIFPGIVSKAPKSGFIDTQTVRLVARSAAWSTLVPNDWRLLGSGLLQNLSPTLRHRDGLRDAFSEGRLTAPDSASASELPGPRRTSDRDRKPPEYFANRIGRVDPDHALTRFTAVQDWALDRLIEEEKAAGRRVSVVDFPTRSGFESTLGEDVKAHYARLLGRLRVRSDLRFVEASALGPLAEGDFIDFTHVDSNGRRLVSERLREHLRRP